MAVPENDDEERMVKAVGRKIDLEEGRSVYVGWSEDGMTVIEFTNNQGTRRALGLYKETAGALRKLLNEGPGPNVAFGLTIDAETPPAQAGEAGTAETHSGSVHEHAVAREGDAP